MSSVVYWQGISSTAPTGIALVNCVDPPYSEILREWNIDKVSITRQLNEYPTASLSFVTCAENESAVRSRFKPNKSVTLFETVFRVTQLQIVKVGDKIYPNYHLSVSVSLEWYWSTTFSDSPFNDSIDDTTLDLDSDLLPAGASKTTTSSKTVDIFTVTARQAGRSTIQSSVAVTGTTTSTDTTKYSTVGDALIDGAAVNGSFMVYSGSSASAISWGSTTTHYISPAEIESDLTFALSVSDSDSSDDSSDDFDKEDTSDEQTPQSPDRDKEEIVETTREEFENAESYADLTIPYYQGDADGARTPNICFDTGGATKKMRTIKERGGQMLETIEETWGYAFISKDVHAFYPDRIPVEYPYIGSGTEGWQKVSETRTTNYFDELGYLVKTETTGYKLARAKQESDSLETCSLYMNALIYGLQSEDGQNNLREIESYEFSQEMPIYDVTTYTLEKMRDYYRDITVDIGSIEPKFCSRMVRSQIDRILIPNPQTDEDGVVRPPVVQVNELVEETRTIITNTKCTPERFKVNQYSRGAEGTGGRDRVVITNSIENLGRPSTHTTIPIKQISWQDLIKKPEVKEDDKTESEKEKQEQKQMVATQKTIASSRNETLSFSMKYHSEFKEGNKVYIEGKTWVILEISSEFNCVLGQVNCESFNLTLGKYNDIAININSNQFANISLIG